MGVIRPSAGGAISIGGQRPPSRHGPGATIAEDHPASKLPRRRLAVMRPGDVVPGVITRLVRGGALVDILLESGEPAFIPLNEIPAKAMSKVRDLIATGTLQEVRVVQLDRASGTATVSLKGVIEEPPDAEEEGGPRGRGFRGRGDRDGRGQSTDPNASDDRGGPPPVRRPVPAPEPPPAVRNAKPEPVKPTRPTAGELARRRQEEILRRMREAPGEG